MNNSYEVSIQMTNQLQLIYAFCVCIKDIQIKYIIKIFQTTEVSDIELDSKNVKHPRHQ